MIHPIIKWLALGSLLAIAITASSVYMAAKPSPSAVIQQKPSKSAQPQITWSPTVVEVTLSPGETASRTVTFTSSAPLRKAEIKLKKEKDDGDKGKDKDKEGRNGSVKPFLSIQPDKIDNVPAGQPQTVR